MADKTGIEWTEATWNPVTGCSKVSQGCKNCYALREWPRMAGNPATVYYGREFTDVRCHPERLDQPLRWKRPRRIFVNSMSDLFHESVPDEFIAKVFNVMVEAKQHTFQVLTKRPERMLDFMIGSSGAGLNYPPIPNIWFGVSVEDQETADQRIPILLQVPAVVRWISAEPLLGKIDLRGWLDVEADCPCGEISCLHDAINWVVVGGETGANKARCMLPDWVRSLRDQCSSAGVPFFFKQWGEFAPDENGLFGSVGNRMNQVGKKLAGRTLDGRTWDEYPA